MVHQKHYLIVDSTDRSTLSNSSSDFIVELPRVYHHIVRVNLLSYTVSNSIYTIDSRNDQLKFYEDIGFSYTTISLTHGVYNGSTLATHIASVMTTNTANYYTYVGAYSSTTLKMTFTATGGDFHFDFTNSNNSHLQMGFDNNSALASASSQVSPNVIRLDNPYCLLQSNLGNHLRSTSDSVSCSFMLQLPSSGSSETFTLNKTYDFDNDINMNVNQIEIRLKDINNKTLNFNGSDSTFLFELIER